MESPHCRRRACTEFPIYGQGVQAGIHRAGDLEPELHQPDVLPAAALPQGCARVGVGPAVVGLDAAELIVEFCPGGAAHHTVHRQAVSSLEGPDRTGGAAAIHAIHCHGGDAALVLGQSVQPELQLLHSAAGRADAQDGAAPGAVREGAGGCFSLAGQLCKVFHRDIDIADLIPGLPPHHAVSGQVELLLESLHGLGHPAAKDPVHGQQAEKGVILGDAVQLPLQGEHRRAPVSLPEGGTRIASGDGLDVAGADDLDIAAVIVLEDAQGIAALICQRDRAPLLEPRAGNGLSVTVFGVVGIHGAGLADVGVEDIIRQLYHHIEHSAAMDVILIVAGGIGDIEGVALTGIPLGVNTVERQRDLAVDVRFQRFNGPSGVDLAGSHIGDIIPEGHRHVPGRGSGPAQMDRNIFGYDDTVQHPAAGAWIGGSRAAAAVPRKQSVGGDDHRRVDNVFSLLGIRDHLRPGQRDLPGKDLDALDADGAVARLSGRQAAHGIGQGRGVVLVQREGAGRGTDGHILGIALGIGDAVSRESAAGDHNSHSLHRSRLPGPIGLDTQDAIHHIKKLLCR